MALDKASGIIANYIARELSLDREREEVIAYSIENMLLGLLGVTFLLLIGLAFNALIPVAVAAISGGTLRRLSGGAHLNNPFKCLSFGTVVYGTIGVLAKYLAAVIPLQFHLHVYYTSLTVSLVIILLFAPVDSPAKPIHSPAFRKKLKAGSVALVLALFFLALLKSHGIYLIAVAAGVLFQSVTLLPMFNEEVKSGEEIHLG